MATPVRSMSSRAVQAERTRQQILQTAQRLFAERGYDATSLQMIADEMGLTKAAVYYHFRAKIDILHAAMEPGIRRVEALLDEEVDETAHQELQPGPPPAYRGRVVEQGLEPLDSGLHGRLQDLVLGAEVVVDGGLGQPHLIGDHLQRGRIVALVGEQPPRCLEDLLPRPLGLRCPGGRTPDRRRHR